MHFLPPLAEMPPGGETTKSDTSTFCYQQRSLTNSATDMQYNDSVLELENENGEYNKTRITYADKKKSASVSYTHAFCISGMQNTGSRRCISGCISNYRIHDITQPI